MIPRSIMENKIKQKQVTVLKVWERRANGVYPKMVMYNDQEYKLCVECKHYHLLNRFSAHHKKCKVCRNEHEKAIRKKDFRKNMYTRWRSLKENSKFSSEFEEFLEFAKTAKCVFTNKTLEEDHKNPSDNILLRLEVDHIIPKSESGDSRISNLQVVPRFWNRLKSTATAKECEEVVELFRNSIL